jgi:hypothetical protein
MVVSISRLFFMIRTSLFFHKMRHEILYKTEGKETLAMILVTGSCRNCPKILGKNPKIFRPEYCFHKVTGIPRNRRFPGRTVRPGEYLVKISCSKELRCQTIVFTLLRRPLTRGQKSWIGHFIPHDS